MTIPTNRVADVQKSIRIEVFTIVWMVVEAAVSIGAGILAGSGLLIAFGIDSVIELVSGAILLWRLGVEARGNGTEQIERAERQAAWGVGASLALLSLYVLVEAVSGLITKAKPDSSLVGIGISAAAVLVMPWLAVTKRRLAGHLHSGALRGDAASSMTCAYLAGTVLMGLVLNTLLRWWWAEDIAALLFLFWLVQETREALEDARGTKMATMD